MSSSYLDHWHRKRVASSAIAILAGAMPASAALAAQTYSQPWVDLRTEFNDNWDLTPGGGDDSDVYGFIGEFQSLFGIATPRSDTSIRPRIVLQEYPDREELSKVLAYLDLRSTYLWEASNLFVSLKLSREDLYNVEFPDAGFDDLIPEDPDAPDSGRVLVGEIRTRFRVNPTYTYRLNERNSIGAAASFDISRYDTELRKDYSFWNLGGFYRWALDQRTDIGVDAYVSHYEARDGSSETDGKGVGVSVVRKFSDLAGVEGRMFYENNDIRTLTSVRSTESTSGWGGNVTAYRNGEVSQWRFTIEQGYWPTGDGGKNQIRQFRVQYERALSERINFDGAVRYIYERAIGSREDEGDRDYARLDLSISYFLTPTWYVAGGYNFVWQEYVSEADDARNNVLFLSVGYHGLGRQRR